MQEAHCPCHTAVLVLAKGEGRERREGRGGGVLLSVPRGRGGRGLTKGEGRAGYPCPGWGSWRERERGGYHHPGGGGKGGLTCPLGDFLCIQTPNTGQLNPLFHTFAEFRLIVNRMEARQSTDWVAANAQFSPNAYPRISPSPPPGGQIDKHYLPPSFRSWR